MKPWTFDTREAGATGTDVYVRHREQGRELSPKDVEEAKLALDTLLLRPANESWLSYVAPWAGTYRFIAGLRPETRKLIDGANRS
jgi:hypothetical protein